MEIAKHRSYGSISISAVALGVFLTTLVSVISPIAVSSPGITHPGQDLATRLENAKADAFYELDVEAPLPYLRGKAAESFDALRKAVIIGAGFDFLAKCGDMLRSGNGKPKVGTALNSRHKSGEAFDYNQEDPRLLLVRENEGGRVLWRTYLLCEKQDGSLGIKANLHTDNAGFVSAYVFDFTAAAEALGWERILPQPGWTNEPIKKEFWHYQLRRDLTLVTRKLFV